MIRDDGELLTVDDVAGLFKVPVSWVYERCRAGAINPLPHLKLGKYLRFRKSALLEYMDDSRRGDSMGPSKKA